MASSQPAIFFRAIGAAMLTATIAVVLASAPAVACGRGCGGRGAYAPAPVYAAPPVYSYACAPYGGCGAAYRRTFYTTRVDIFRGPRWDYAAAYYNPRRRGSCSRRAGGCLRRAYLAGPIVPVQGPIGRRW